MSRSPHFIDCSHSEAVGGERQKSRDLVDGRVRLGLQDFALGVIPGPILSNPDVNEIMGHQRVVGVERRRPGEVHSSRGEGHDQGSTWRVRNVCRESE